MAATAEPQAIPVICTDITAAIVAALDAVLVSHQMLRPHFAALPDVTNYPVVDLAIRLWASVHPEVTLVEWGQWSRQPTADNPGYWIEGYKLQVDYREICTVHTPDGLRVRQPKSPSVVIQLPVAPPALDVIPMSNAEERAELAANDDSTKRMSLLELD